ncbi:hypothetical protein EJB05_46929 [Eragrostis curvula]|uniref:Uncharacterized protein n=1 Tax=Eragrostis curvula TaxID=38414 RepID=A0A5J9T663_9POAL|nr:hypothetical protein EJB05_46929 [Eragrostis curvula]
METSFPSLWPGCSAHSAHNDGHSGAGDLLLLVPVRSFRLENWKYPTVLVSSYPSLRRQR